MKPGSKIYTLVLVLVSGLIPAIICQFFSSKPQARHIHISSFRYGKDPSIIRCNRGDTLHITFSSEDTGHSFFLQEFDIDAKVTPARDEVEVFRPSDPTIEPYLARELVFVARHKGIQNYIVSKSNYRCHVWCGPMHAFEQGKLIILPNTLLAFGAGSIIGIIMIWLVRVMSGSYVHESSTEKRRDLFPESSLSRKLITSRWPQVILTILALVMVYLVIITTVFGTKVSGRNLGVMLMWAVWLFLLVTVLTPWGGRLWCTICPLPLIGDRLQRGSFVSPETGKTGSYNNIFRGLSLKWPKILSNNWSRLIIFTILATFSTTLVASPRTSGLTLTGLIVFPTLLALVFELRAFCRFLCPISVFVTPFSELSPVALRSRSKEVCQQCKPRFCTKGNANGWACPYGLNTGELSQNSDCGLCLECVRSCTFKNVSVFSNKGLAAPSARDMSEAWLSVAIFTTSVVYSFLYLGHWPVLRDYVNILDKHNWNLFARYSASFWILTLVAVPSVLYLLAYTGKKISGENESTKNIFLKNVTSLMPLGLALWIAFVVPMLFVNVTFIAQSLSDPFGWGWDFFGTANIPWQQFIPQYIPWIQAALVLAGLHFSLRNLSLMPKQLLMPSKILLLRAPMALFLIASAAGMMVFFTN